MWKRGSQLGAEHACVQFSLLSIGAVIGLAALHSCIAFSAVTGRNLELGAKEKAYLPSVAQSKDHQRLVADDPRMGKPIFPFPVLSRRQVETP